MDDEVISDDWAEAPEWLDTVAESDVMDCPEQSAAFGEYGPLSVPEMLHAARAAGPGPEAARLLVALGQQVLTGEERLSVVELWQPQLGWTTGAEQAALLDLVGPEPDPTNLPDLAAGTDPAGVADPAGPGGAGVLPDPAGEFVSLELAAALNVTVGHAAGRVRQARLMASTFPATQAALAAGALDPYRVWVLLETLTTLDVAVAQQIEAEILPRAASMTGTALRRALRKAARQADPQWGVRMFAKSRKTRRVGFDRRGQDGLVMMYAYLPPVEAVAMEQHLDRAAKVPAPDPDDQRCADERRADALVSCVLGTAPGDPTTPLAPKVITQLLISLPTLLGLREDTGELAGYGAVPAGMARELATDAEFQRMIHDPVDGHLLDYKTKTYRPPKHLDDYVRARDRYCRYPGTSTPAATTDLDHTKPFHHPQTCDADPPQADPSHSDVPVDEVPADRVPNDEVLVDEVPNDSVQNDVLVEQVLVDEVPPDEGPAEQHGGTTSADNLACLCRFVHRAKTHGHYQTRQDPDGTLHFTTALGRTYTTTPWDYRPDSER